MIAARLFGVVLAGVLITDGSPVAAQPTTGKPQAGSTTRAVELVVQSGHTAEIRALEYARSGRFFATAGKDSTIRIWSPGGALIRTIVTRFWVDALALSRDSNTLLVAQRSGVIELWSVDGTLLQKLPPVPIRRGVVRSVALSDDNRYAAIGTSREIVVYRLADSAETWLTAETSPSSADGLAFTPDGARLVSAHGDGRLRFWALDGRVLKTVQALDYPVKTLAVSPDGKTLAAAGVLGTRDEERVKNVADKLATTLWDLEGNPMGRFSSHSTASLRFTPDGTHLVSGGQHDNRVNVYTRAGQLVDTITVGSTWQRSPQRIALSPDGQSIVTADDDLDPPGLKIWNRAGGLERSLERFSGNLTNVAMAPDGTMFVTLAADRRVRIWSLAGRLLRSVSGHTDYPSALAYAPNGNYVASGGAEVIIWSRDGRSLATLNGFGNGANVLTFSSDSRFLFCGDGSGTVHVFDLKDRQARRIKAHDGRVEAIALHPSGRWFATGAAREHVRLWTIDGTLVAERKFPDKIVTPVGSAFALAFSGDGQHLVVGTSNRTETIQILDLNARLVASIKTSHSVVNAGSVLISPSGRWLVATVNNQIGIWDWSTRKLVRVLRGHSGRVEGLAFTPDERHLVSASHDSTARVWKVETGDSMALLSRGADWIMFTPDGYFDASHYGGELVAMVRGLEAFSVDQFATRLNRPDLVLRRLGVGSDEFIEHLELQHRKRLQRAGLRDDPAASEIEAPEVRLTSARREGKHALLEAEVQARAPLQSYQIYVNGVPTFPGSGKPLHGTAARVSERIELGQGLNTVEITAFDVRGVEAFRARWSSTYAGEGKGDLYFIGFGVARYQNPALNLQFADKDALDLANVMQRYQPHFRKVVVRTYVNEAVTVENIVKAKEVLRDARVDDTVVVFVSGHGAYDLSREATYYYATHNVDVKDLAGTAASFERIESLLRDIGPRRKLLLVDTCESGEIDDASRAEIEARRHAMGLDGRTSAALQSDRASRPRRVFLYDRDRYIYNDLTRRTGALVFSAAHAGELSFESPKIQNGVFTWEIVDALVSGKADVNRDGTITLDELQAYVSRNVAVKTGGLQRPTMDRDNIHQRFGFPVLR